MTLGSIVLLSYLAVGALLACAALAALRHRQKHEPGSSQEAQDVVDRLGVPAVIAAIMVFWPALIVIARRK